MTTDRESVAQALDQLGYQIDRTWKFKLRKDERTNSAFINNDGCVYDFGSGFHGDLVKILQEYHGLCLRESVIKAKELLNQPIQFDFSRFENRQQIKKEGFINEKYLNLFVEKSKNHPKVFLKLLSGLLPSITCENKMKEIASKYKIGLSIGMINKNGCPIPERLIMPIRNEKGKIITFWKYNPFLPSKDKLRYTNGRCRGAFNMQILLNKDNSEEILFICEGEKDVLNATANGFMAVTPGGAACVFKEEQILLFKDKKVVILGDNDEAGNAFNRRIEAQLKPVAKVVRHLNWSKFLKSKGEAFVPPKGFDLTDWLKIMNSK